MLNKHLDGDGPALLWMHLTNHNEIFNNVSHLSQRWMPAKWPRINVPVIRAAYKHGPMIHLCFRNLVPVHTNAAQLCSIRDCLFKHSWSELVCRDTILWEHKWIMGFIVVSSHVCKIESFCWYSGLWGIVCKNSLTFFIFFSHSELDVLKRKEKKKTTVICSTSATNCTCFGLITLWLFRRF